MTTKEMATKDASKESAFPAGPPEPNPLEAMLFFNILKNIKEPNIDWEQVAKDSGHKNGASTKKRFYQIKVKLGLETKSPKSPRKAPQSDAGGDEPETPGPAASSVQSTPEKPQKTSKTVKAAKAAKTTPTKSAKRRKTEPVKPEPADADPFVDGPGPESPDVLAGSDTPDTPMRSAGFIAINSPPVTPTKAKSKGRTPLPVAGRKKAAAAFADAGIDEDAVKDEQLGRVSPNVCSLIQAALEMGVGNLDAV